MRHSHSYRIWVHTVPKVTPYVEHIPSVEVAEKIIANFMSNLNYLENIPNYVKFSIEPETFIHPTDDEYGIEDCSDVFDIIGYGTFRDYSAASATSSFCNNGTYLPIHPRHGGYYLAKGKENLYITG